PTPPPARPPLKPPPPHVVIVGGGLAGLAAASALVDRGLRLTLLESRPRLGGRASSFSDPVTGELVDNCQHVSMSCCTNLADFCRRVGLQGSFHRESEIVFLGEDGRVSRLGAGRLPAPLHLAESFLGASYLTAAEKLRVAYGLVRLIAIGDRTLDQPLQDWLLEHGQTEGTIERYWAPVLISALNERLGQMDVRHARKVFLDGFLRNRDGFQLEIPLVPLGELYGRRLESWLDAREVDVRLTTGVRRIELDVEGAVTGVTLRSGEKIQADFVVLAVPFDRIEGLLGDEEVGRLPSLNRLGELRASPITGVHLWFDRPVCPYRHVVTLNRTIQWVFNHTAIQGRRPGDAEAGEYLQLVISASYDLLGLSKESIRDRMLGELAEIWPEVGSARLLRWWVVTEHGATFAVRPGVDSLRPPQRTAIDGLFLSGDWTATGWPATMEGAVRSGYLAAEQVLVDLGRPVPLVAPGLKPGRLARWLLGSPAEHRDWRNAIPAQSPTV
ncbi:MAG: hydroxysqualene dehydroxylase HpnE, partial [Isosphaeraceae bacterium]